MPRRLQLLAGDMEAGKGQLRFRPDSVEDAVETMESPDYNVPSDYWAVYEVVEEGPTGTLPATHQVRDWDALAPSTRDRYLKSKRLERIARDAYGRSGRKADVIRHWYEMGGDMRAARGHQTGPSYASLRSEVTARELGQRPTGRLELWIDPGNRGKKGKTRRK
jgi:hypothetical protein